MINFKHFFSFLAHPEATPFPPLPSQGKPPVFIALLLGYCLIHAAVSLSLTFLSPGNGRENLLLAIGQTSFATTPTWTLPAVRRGKIPHPRLLPPPATRPLRLHFPLRARSLRLDQTAGLPRDDHRPRRLPGTGSHYPGGIRRKNRYPNQTTHLLLLHPVLRAHPLLRHPDLQLLH